MENISFVNLLCVQPVNDAFILYILTYGSPPQADDSGPDITQQILWKKQENLSLFCTFNTIH